MVVDKSLSLGLYCRRVGVFRIRAQGQLPLSLIENLRFPKAATPKLPHALPTTHAVPAGPGRRGLEKERLLSSLLCKDTQT